VAKYAFEREVEDQTFKVEGEVLPSGTVLVVFNPPLPGRTKVLSVEADTVADLVRTLCVETTYDPEQECMSMTLAMVNEEDITDFEDAPSPEFKAATCNMPAEVVVEMVVDQMVEACPHCGKYQFGEDVVPSDDDTGNDKPKKTYLN
jgi:hypothetical protein